MNDPKQPKSLDTISAMAKKPRRAAICLVAIGLMASGCAGDPETGAAATNETAVTPTTAAARAKTTTTVAPTTEASDEPKARAETDPSTTPAQTPIAFDLPSVDLTNIRTGSTVNLTSVADGKPLVLWFWAPH